LDREIKEIRELMVRSTEEIVSRRKLNMGEPATTIGKQQQQQHSRGAGGQLQEEVWDPGGFQQSLGSS
jgi:hypothetical protein